jgi:spore cortex formation protein SpoVR/YcgB (stage V sporulation)
MFLLMDEGEDTDELRVQAIHDERGYRKLRRALARQYDVAHLDADIQVVDVDLAGDRRLVLQHRMLDGILLDERSTRDVLQHLADLWGYKVCLQEFDEAIDGVAREHIVQPRSSAGQRP